MAPRTAPPRRRSFSLLLVIVALGSGCSSPTAPDGDQEVLREDQELPVLVAGGLTFKSVSVGVGHTCGITTQNEAYCWGANHAGRLGNGTQTDRSRPTPVGGGHRFTTIAAGGSHTCAISDEGAVFCWGPAALSGLDPTLPDQTSPALLSDEHLFVSIDAAGAATCAVTNDGQVFCWGQYPLENAMVDRSAGLEFVDVGVTTVGIPGFCVRSGVIVGLYPVCLEYRQPELWSFVCGVTTVGKAYCWENWSMTPTLLSAEVTFRTFTPFCGITLTGDVLCGGTPDGLVTRAHPGPPLVAITDNAECGLTAVGNAYCDGALVSPDLVFESISTHDFADHRCAVASGGAAYCWGKDRSGQLGIGDD